MDKKNNDLSRKDFFNWLGAMIGGGMIIAGGKLAVEYGNNPYSMAARISDKLFYADLNKERDPEGYNKAQKLAFVWMFAETARQYGKKVGFEKSGEAIGHYLYGEGRTLDISNWLEDEAKNNDGFWPSLFSDARYGIKKEEGIENDAVAARMLKNRLKEGHTFILAADSHDLFNAIGISTCKLQANLEFAINEDEGFAVDKKLSDIRLELTDKYDWDGKGNPAELGEKGRDFLSGYFGAIRTFMLNNGELVAETLKNLSLPSFYVDQFMSVYSSGMFKFFGTLSEKAGGKVLDIENELTGGLGVDESSLALLEEVGARQYYINGSLRQINPVSVDE